MSGGAQGLKFAQNGFQTKAEEEQEKTDESLNGCLYEAR